jgi:hypothetical protein
VKARNSYLLDEGMKNRAKKEGANVEKIRHDAMKDYATAVEGHLKERAPLLLKGSFISAESFTKLRYLMSFDLDHEEHALILRSELPKVAKPSCFSMYGKVVDEEVEKDVDFGFYLFSRCKIINTVLNQESDIMKIPWKKIYSKVI